MAGVHAKKGPSGAERLHACPGALAAVELVPPQFRKTSGPAAQLGTAAHFLLEKCLEGKTEPETFRDRIIVLLGDHEDGSMLRVGAKEPDPKDVVFFRVDDDMVRGVTMAVNYVNRRMAEFDPDLVTLMLESKTNPVPDREDTWGTADVTIDIFLMLLEVVDYKNGRNLVEHKNNPQVLSYLAGRAHDTHWVHDRYAVTIVQPNADHEEGRVRTVEVTREELLAFVNKHRNAAETADYAADLLADDCGGDINADMTGFADDTTGKTWADLFLKAGDHCMYCELGDALMCPVKKRWVEQQAAISFDADPPDEETVGHPGAAAAGRILAWSPYLLAMIKLARQVEFSELQAGRVLPGRKAVRLKARGRKFKPGLGDAYAVAAKLVKGGYISDNERTLLFTEPELLSGPKIEKLVSTKKVDGPEGKKVSLRTLFSQEFLYMPEGRIVTAPLSDPRPEVTVSAASDFDNEELEDFE